MLPLCYGFVTAPTSILSPFYRCVTGVTAPEGVRGNKGVSTPASTQFPFAPSSDSTQNSEERLNDSERRELKIKPDAVAGGTPRVTKPQPFFPQHCLYFLPLRQGQGSLRPTLGPARTGLAFSTAAAASLTTSLSAGRAGAAGAAESAPVAGPPKALVD